MKSRNIDLYKLALVHRSASVLLEDGGLINNERLEFLGDAILQSISSDILFMRYPDCDEGELTKLRSKVVGRDSLNALALQLGLDREIVTSPASLVKESAILGDGFEAIVGAIYLDRGYDVTYKVILNLIAHHIDLDKLKVTDEDFKSRVLEWGQKYKMKVEFVVNQCADDTGDFEAILYIDGVDKGRGRGKNKKMSEQKAAGVFFESYTNENL